MRGAVEVVCLIAVEALLLVLSWKLRRGQWLNLIAGNTFADEEERRRPYQRRMGRDVANVLALCAVGLPVLMWLARLADEGALGHDAVRLAVAVFVAAMVIACIVVSVKTRRAMRSEDRAMGVPEPPKVEESLDRTQAIIVCVLVVAMLAISLLPVLLAS